VATLIAVGGSQWPSVSQFDLFPLLGVVVALLVVRFALRLALTVPTTILAISAGTAWTWSVEGWGWPLTTLAALLLTFVVAAFTSRPGSVGRRGGMG
jgi:hypothetical protein